MSVSRHRHRIRALSHSFVMERRSYYTPTTPWFRSMKAIGGWRRKLAKLRAISERRRAALPPWRSLKFGDISRIAKQLGVWHSTIVRDYQIIKAREFDAVFPMEKLIKLLRQK